jgi:hypothetical protein
MRYGAVLSPLPSAKLRYFRGRVLGELFDAVAGGVSLEDDAEALNQHPQATDPATEPPLYACFQLFCFFPQRGFVAHGVPPFDPNARRWLRVEFLSRP